MKEYNLEDTVTRYIVYLWYVLKLGRYIALYANVSLDTTVLGSINNNKDS